MSPQSLTSRSCYTQTASSPSRSQPSSTLPRRTSSSRGRRSSRRPTRPTAPLHSVSSYMNRQLQCKTPSSSHRSRYFRNPADRLSATPQHAIIIPELAVQIRPDPAAHHDKPQAAKLLQLPRTHHSAHSCAPCGLRRPRCS